MRTRTYQLLLDKSREGKATVGETIQFGYKLMRKAKLHHHFFIGHSLLTNAHYLVFFALKLPFDFRNLSNNHFYSNQIVTEEQMNHIIQLFEKRISQRLPVEYITNEAFYLDYVFYVNSQVLVPRSVMNTRFNEFLQKVTWKNYRVLDLCTGSGCIGITLALLHPNISVDLVDISAAALAVADINIKKYQLENRITCIQSDLFAKIKGTYDLIISNPPYVSVKEYQQAPQEFMREPSMALTAGKDGLEILDRILQEAKHYLNPQGTLIAEVGYITAKRIKKKYHRIPFTWFHYKKAGKESVLDKLIRWIANIENVFLCRAKDLP